MTDIFADLASLASQDASERVTAAARLGDALAARALDSGSVQPVIARLVDAFTDETVYEVREEVLHTVLEASGQYTLAFETVVPLTDAIAATDAELLTYALFILSTTHDPRAIALVEPYQRHSDPHVAAAVAEALAELRAATATEVSGCQ